MKIINLVIFITFFNVNMVFAEELNCQELMSEFFATFKNDPIDDLATDSLLKKYQGKSIPFYDALSVIEKILDPKENAEVQTLFKELKDLTDVTIFQKTNPFSYKAAIKLRNNFFIKNIKFLTQRKRIKVSWPTFKIKNSNDVNLYLDQAVFILSQYSTLKKIKKYKWYQKIFNTIHFKLNAIQEEAILKGKLLLALEREFSPKSPVHYLPWNLLKTKNIVLTKQELNLINSKNYDQLRKILIRKYGFNIAQSITFSIMYKVTLVSTIGSVLYAGYIFNSASTYFDEALVFDLDLSDQDMDRLVKIQNESLGLSDKNFLNWAKENFVDSQDSNIQEFLMELEKEVLQENNT